MILPTKKTLLSRAILLLFCFTVFAANKRRDYDDYSLIEKCDNSTHIYEAFITYHEDYDRYVECCTNRETGDYVYNENIIYHTEIPSCDVDSSLRDIDNSQPTIQSYQDHFNYQTTETRRQETEENKITEIQGYNQPLTTNEKIIYELAIPKGTVLYLRDTEGRKFDSSLILDKVHTIRDFITALDSPIINARFERVKANWLRNQSSSRRPKDELILLDALISKQITEILSKIIDPELKIAQSAFDELKKLWPWKREHTFLVSDVKYGTGEPGFIANLGINIMAIAEATIITRSDYIAKHASRRQKKIIMECKEKCFLLQQQGRRHDLFNQKQELYRCITANGQKNDFAANACLAITDTCLLHPATDIFYSIANIRRLEEAYNHLKNLKIQIINQAKQHNIISMEEITTWVVDYYGFDVLDAAQNCYKSRPDSNRQLYHSDTINAILDNIEFKSLQDAYIELINLEKHIDNDLKERNIVNLTAQKQYIKKSFGKNALKIAHKKYENRSDHKKIAESFINIDVSQAAIKILENNYTYLSIANEMDDLAKHVFGNASLCNLNNLSKIESDIYDSIDAMKKAETPHTFIFNFSMASHVLEDVQQLAYAILSGKNPILKRSSELLVRGVSKFLEELHPCTQASNMSHLVSQLGSLVKKGGSALWNDPIATTRRGINSACTLAGLLVNTAHFASDVTVGKLYLSPEEYKQRTDTFYKIIEPLQGVTAEQYTDFIAQLAADALFFKGFTSIYNFLIEIEALGKLSTSAATVANTFKKGFDRYATDNSIVITAEGLAMKMSGGLKAGGGRKFRKKSTAQKAIAQKATAQRVTLRVANMKEFFELPFGKTLHQHSVKTAYRYQKSAIYKVTTEVPNTFLRKGYFYYLDSLHCDHLEAFDKQLKVIAVYNLDGTFNRAKFEAAQDAGRIIKLT